MQRLLILTTCLLLVSGIAGGHSPSFETYINPIIPGDHPDPTLTKIGNYFYTSGSSFNPTPKIYRSTDLVHWEVIAQPVSASWSVYGDEPGGGIWGGHMVLYNGTYWHYFGRGGGSMYFVTAEQPEGPWSNPTRVEVPSGMSSLGVDNSIFIDDETGQWYLLTKHLPINNHIVELGNDGQPNGNVLNLNWLNPDSAYGWAEGPVMWKDNGYYYYSFAQHLSGAQYVMFSETLTDDESAWTVIGENIFTGTRSNFGTPNHISPVVKLDDGTSWTVAHSNHSTSWHAQGRQGLLCQVTYDDQYIPVIQFPSGNAVEAPVLPHNGVPWTVPRSDMFNSAALNPDWSHLGYTPDATYSLDERPGWLYLEPYNNRNTVIQNDGEHGYSLITRVDFEPESNSDEAGLWIINGPETHSAKVFSTVNSEGISVFSLSYQETRYDATNTIGSVFWLKLLRNEHFISGYYSTDGIFWIRIGGFINAQTLDTEKPNYNDFTGNQQGLYVKGKPALFDLYIYKDAYTPIKGSTTANQTGTSLKYSNGGYVLYNIHADDWAMYAGVDFGNADYAKTPVALNINASCTTTGSGVEVWLDSLDTGQKIAECPINDTGSSNTYQTFSCNVSPVTGQHDVYLRFTGTETKRLFQLDYFYFKAEGDTSTSVPSSSHAHSPFRFDLMQNYPNPFNPETRIIFEIPHQSYVSLKIFDLLGREIEELAGKEFTQGKHSILFDGSHLASGIYFYTLEANDFAQTKKMFIIK